MLVCYARYRALGLSRNPVMASNRADGCAVEVEPWLIGRRADRDAAQLACTLFFPPSKAVVVGTLCVAWSIGPA